MTSPIRDGGVEIFGRTNKSNYQPRRKVTVSFDVSNQTSVPAAEDPNNGISCFRLSDVNDYHQRPRALCGPSARLSAAQGRQSARARRVTRAALRGSAWCDYSGRDGGRIWPEGICSQIHQLSFDVATTDVARLSHQGVKTTVNQNQKYFIYIQGHLVRRRNPVKCVKISVHSSNRRSM